VRVLQHREPHREQHRPKSQAGGPSWAAIDPPVHEPPGQGQGVGRADNSEIVHDLDKVQADRRHRLRSTAQHHMIST
jgi:hypothetical protein